MPQDASPLFTTMMRFYHSSLLCQYENLCILYWDLVLQRGFLCQPYKTFLILAAAAVLLNSSHLKRKLHYVPDGGMEP